MTALWGDPPPPKSKVKWLDESGELRARPREWACIAERPSSVSAETMVTNIRRAILAAFSPPGAFDARYEDKKVWAVYLGDGHLPADIKSSRYLTEG